MGIVCGAFLALCVARAAEEPLAQAERIFAVIDSAVGTTTSPMVVNQQLKKLAPKPQDDVRVQYAFVVALVQAKRHAEALTAVERLVKQSPAYLPAHRLRIWLLITLHKQREALPALQQLAAALPTAELADEAEEECVAAAHFLGVVIGYFVGPGEKLVSSTALDACRAKVEKSLPPNRRTTFDAGLDDVKNHANKVVAKSAEAATPKDEDRTKELTGKQADLEKLRADAKRQSKDNEEQLRKYWDKLREEAQRTATNYESLARQSALQDQAWQQASFTLQQLNAAYANAKPGSSNQNSNLTANLVYAARAESVLATQLINTQNGMDQLMRYAKSIQVQMSEVVAEAQRLGLAFEEQEQVLKQQTESIAQRRKRHDEAVAAKERRQSQRQAVFSEYEEFSYADEKQRVLDALAAEK